MCELTEGALSVEMPGGCAQFMGRTLAVSEPGESTRCSISHSEYSCKEYTLVQPLRKEIWQRVSETQKEGFISFDPTIQFPCSK